MKNWGIPRYMVDLSGQIGGGICSLANAAQIFILEEVFNELAEKLNDYEVHSTDTEYIDKLTEKVFIFQSINSFFSYIYIAFFKQIQANTPVLQPGGTALPGNYSCAGSCMEELRNQLAAIFLSKVIIANVKDIAMPCGRCVEHIPPARLTEGPQVRLLEEGPAGRAPAPGIR